MRKAQLQRRRQQQQPLGEQRRQRIDGEPGPERVDGFFCRPNKNPIGFAVPPNRLMVSYAYR